MREKQEKILKVDLENAVMMDGFEFLRKEDF